MYSYLFMQNKYLKIKKRVFEIVEAAKPGDKASKVFDIFIITLIILNVIAIICASVRSLSSNYSLFFKIFEIISVVIFTIEYILRIWSVNIWEKYKGIFLGRLKYAVTPMILIDLFAILPFYIPMVIPIDLRFLRVIRLIRIFRIFKFGRYFESMQMLGRILKKKKAELLITLFVVVILLIISSSLIYEFENVAQPEAFASIPSSMWWAVITLTTVGYGDVYPITVTGKLLSAAIALLGIGLFALPAGIISSGIIAEIQEKKKKNIKCPKCGTIIDKDN